MEKSYYRLEIWQRAQSLCLKMHKLTLDLPNKERCGLIPKLRNASELVPLKIAHGARALEMKGFIEELTESYKLLIRLKTEILILKHLKYIDEAMLSDLDAEVNELMDLITKMVHNLQQKAEALHHSFAYTFPPFSGN